MRIIPAIDIINGACVRLTKGDYSKTKVYSQDVLSLAQEYQKSGIRFLHLVDLDAAKQKKLVNFSLVKKICKQTKLIVDYGGGISSKEDIERLFDAGVSQVNIGSMAIKKRNTFIEWLNHFGPDKIILSADADQSKLKLDAWESKTDLDVIKFIKDLEMEGLQYVVCTDIAKDGLLEGPSFELYKKILDNSNIKLVASGGVSSKKDLLSLRKLGCNGAIIGKAIYENYLSIEEIAELC
jgi:phosphoribosylformimino-5-aminoimidazole carboxamide ribotide isomerase